MKRALIASTMAAALGLTSGFTLAADQQQVQAQTHQQDQIYGSQLMTEQERAELRDKMRSAMTTEERDLIRKENHDQMTARAKASGVTLPAAPAARGSGMGPRAGGGGGGAGRGR